jgi:hypothetical protein
MLHVQLGGFRSMVRRVVNMALGGVSVVRRRFVVTGFVMRRRFPMMARRLFMVFRRKGVMLCRLFGHASSLDLGAGLGQGVDCARLVKEASGNCERQNMSV